MSVIATSNFRSTQQYWTTEEDVKLRDMWESKHNWTEIAIALNRTKESVCRHAQLKGLPNLKNRFICPTEFSSRERQIVYGTLMGDASIHKSPNAESYYLEMYHKYEHVDYLHWFEKELIRFNPKLFIWHPYSSYYDRIVDRCNFRTSSTTVLWRQLREEFYRGEHTKQFIPTHEITPLALAVLWQDDGCYSHGYGTLSIQNYPRDERDKFIIYVQENYDIECHIIKSGVLGIGRRSLDRLVELIRPHTIDLFKYKIGD